MKKLLTSQTRFCHCGIALLCFGAFFTARADVIDFEAQGAAAPSNFNGTVNSPLVIDGVTFTGGQLLNHESGPAPDQTAVYGTISPNFVTGAYTDPLPITFSTPVSGFSILVTNVIADTFTVADNLGGTESIAIGTDGEATFNLSDVGITSVTISSANLGSWDFAIDNVTFTPAAVPEPGSVFLLSSVMGAILLLGRRKMIRKA